MSGSFHPHLLGVVLIVWTLQCTLLYGDLTLTTFAGSGAVSFAGDGGLALNAALNHPLGLVVFNRSIFIADSYNNRVRRIRDGIVETVAGSGNPGSGTPANDGDGGSALEASIQTPCALDMDLAGCLYVAQLGNSVVRKIFPNGTIITIAGTGISGYDGDGPATRRSLNGPYGVYVHRQTSEHHFFLWQKPRTDDVYIADSFSCLIRVVRVSTGLMTTIAGVQGSCSGLNPPGIHALQATLNAPASSIVDDLDPASPFYNTVYIVDQSGLKKLLSNGTIYSLNVAYPGGKSMYSITGVVLASSPYGDRSEWGSVLYWSADYDCVIVRSNVFDGNAPTLVAGTGQPSYSESGISGNPLPALSSAMNFPVRISMDKLMLDSAHIFVADTRNNRIREVFLASTPILMTTLAGISNTGFVDGGVASGAAFATPFDVDTDTAGNVYIADTYHASIRYIESRTGVVRGVAGVVYSDECDSQASCFPLRQPESIFLDQDILYVCDTLANRVVRFPVDNGVGGQVEVLNSHYQVATPQSVHVAQNRIFVLEAAQEKNSLLEIVPGYANPIRIIPRSSSFDTRYTGDGGPASNATVSQPLGLYVTRDLEFYIADTGNNLIRWINRNGTITSIAGVPFNRFGAGLAGSNLEINSKQALVNAPSAVLVDERTQMLFFSDGANNRVRQINLLTFEIVTVAGAGAAGFNGDSTTGSLVSLMNFPIGLALAARPMTTAESTDVDGAVPSILIADSRNNRVRILALAPPANASGLSALTWALAMGLPLLCVAFGGVLVFRHFRRTRQKQADLEFDLLDGIVRITPSEVKILEVVGSGASAIVHKAIWKGTEICVKLYRNDSLNVNVPMKTSSGQYLSSSEMHAFTNECRINTKLGSFPRVVPFLGGCYQPPNNIFVALVFMPHGSISDLLITNGQLPVHERVSLSDRCNNMRLLAQMLVDSSSAIVHVHSSQVLHRDIASRNFLVDLYHRVCVCDFGMSCSIPTGESTVVDKQTLLAVKWSAPEVLQNGVYSFKSDVFSFAVFIFEVVAHEEPFSDIRSLQEVGNGIVRKQNPLRPKLPPECPRFLAVLMQECWQIDPAQRPTMSEVNQRLTQFSVALMQAGDDVNAALRIIDPIGGGDSGSIVGFGPQVHAAGAGAASAVSKPVGSESRHYDWLGNYRIPSANDRALSPLVQRPSSAAVYGTQYALLSD